MLFFLKKKLLFYSRNDAIHGRDPNSSTFFEDGKNWKVSMRAHSPPATYGVNSSSSAQNGDEVPFLSSRALVDLNEEDGFHSASFRSRNSSQDVFADV